MSANMRRLTNIASPKAGRLIQTDPLPSSITVFFPLASNNAENTRWGMRWSGSPIGKSPQGPSSLLVVADDVKGEALATLIVSHIRSRLVNMKELGGWNLTHAAHV
jgi:hypothetical protein